MKGQMNTEKPKKTAAKTEKSYSKPEVRKHKSMVVISGSGDSNCFYNVASYQPGLMTYYH